MVKIWFEAKNIKIALKLAQKIWKLKEFDDYCVMIETPKKVIAWYGGEKKMNKQLLKKIERRKFEKKK